MPSWALYMVSNQCWGVNAFSGVVVNIVSWMAGCTLYRGGGRALGVVQRLRPAPNNVFCASVVDLDPVGSGTFCQIRIRFFPDPGKTGNFIMG